MGRSTDLSNCYLYHIVDKENIVHYVGSTSNLNSRKSKHKYNCRTQNCKEYNFDIYRYIRDHGGFENFEIVPIKKIENISNRTELRIAEQQEMNKFSGLKNKYGSYTSEEERVEQSREWNKNNREYRKKWQKDNPEKKRESDRKYYETNKEKKLEYQRKYRQQKKELKAIEQ